mgnify:CR=1 FL=1
MRENVIERALREDIKKKGGWCLKFVSPGTAGVPDRICLLPGGVIAFVEVKTRTGASREKPIDAVDYRKRQRIVNTAAQYLRSHRGHPVRFDVMEVYVSEREGGLQLLKTRHVKHVFAYDINTMKPIPYV